MTTTEPAGSGLLVIDKPSGWTSHQVVGRVRRLVGTRKVGHAGTLDPMATGVLLVGVNRATRLLGHLSGRDKSYDATIRLGQATFTDDAEGEIVSETPVVLASLADTAQSGDSRGLVNPQSARPNEQAHGRSPQAGLVELDRESLDAQIAALTGDIMQTPSTVSAIKVDGQRAYARARRGEQVELRARPVTVSSFRVRDIRPALTRHVPVVDVDVTIDCSTGTYVRSLARDVGEALGVGGHLTALRRTRVGPFTLDEALPPSVLESFAGQPSIGSAPRASAPALASISPGETPALMPLGDVAAKVFPTLALTADQALDVRHGRKLPVAVESLTALLYKGDLYALYEPTEHGAARAVAVFVA